MLIAAALVLLLLLLFLPAIRRNRELAHLPRGGGNTVAAELSRAESAKSLYAADHGLKADASVTMGDLVRGGYLKAARGLPNVHFEVGVVGTPVTYTFDAAGQQEHFGRDSKNDDHTDGDHAH